jgi:thiol-disulfide isomerase/thioredoxin
MEIINKTNTAVNTLVKESINKAISYTDFRAQVAKHVEDGTSSGPYQSEALSHYTLLNNSRMKRLDKTIKIDESIAEKFKSFKGNQTWIVLTESWCGDAAHSMPVMNKVAELAENIDFKVLHRDENIELMNQFLTNGSMSIPKLILFDNDSQEVINDWGPSPSTVQQMTKDFKALHETLTPEFKKEVQVWYNQNKGKCIAGDLVKLIATNKS